MDSLVGCTGFVGSNIAAHGKFEGLYNSKNIKEAYGTNPDVLIYAGLRPERGFAEQNPEEDMKNVLDAITNIENINPEKLVLISTIDVYEEPLMATEEKEAKGKGHFGKHRVHLENWVKEHVKDYLIIRLPGLFGSGMKKNFIHDLKSIPALPHEKKLFHHLDSRAVYQYYNLSNLYGDIRHGLDLGIDTLNIATEPVSVEDIYRAFTGRTFDNKIDETPAKYDFRSIYFNEFTGYQAGEGFGGYLYSKNEILREIKKIADEEIGL